jgi:endonuclease YncB( thermonuclease family)
MPARRGGSRLAVLTALALLLAPAAARAQSCTMPRKPAGLVPASVVRVVDGDTIVVRLGDGRTTRVRLIGIDTPEVHPSDKLRRDAQRTGKDAAAIQALGARASEFTRKHLAGRTIDLERDATALDRYGRTLAYVWLGGDLYNLVIVREGYAGLLTIPPNVKYAGTLAACHRTAREARRGLWAAGE